MSTRVRTALVVGSVFLLVLVFGGEVGFGLLVAALAAVGAAEYERIAQPLAGSRDTWFVVGWAAVVVLSFLSSSAALPGGLLCVGVIFYMWMWVAGPGPGPHTLNRWGVALGAWIFVAYFLGHALWIRRFGISPIIYLAAVIWLGDTAAYYVGTAFGSRALAPTVSPKKSVEGALASLAAGISAAALAGAVLPLPHSFSVSVALGAGLNAVGQLGDLSESLLKRCGGVKDSGNLFPGHGGVLDRIDGFLLTVPCYAVFLVVRGT